MSLAARAVVAGYGAHDVLRGVDLELGRGITAIVGPNGAGKSTLVRVLAGLLRPRSGDVRLGGADLFSLSRREIARRIAVVPQLFDSVFPFTGREVVSLGRTAHLRAVAPPSPDDHEAVRRALAELELGELESRRIDRLSGGERQRAVLAMALAQDAGILLLDEPTVHLDPAHQRATLVLLRRLAAERGLTVLAVLHDLNLAAAMCERMVLFADGAVRADGPPGRVLTQGALDAIFGPGLALVGAGESVAVIPQR
ncbi:ABC transporter ATP-binding protein [soil metagenome]